MKRRHVLAGAGCGISGVLAGCLGDVDASNTDNAADDGTRPPGSLEMNPITDTQLARRVTYRTDRRQHTSEPEVAATVIDSGSATFSDTNRPFPEDKPFVYDGSIYELSYEATEIESATSFFLTIEEVDNDVPDNETIAFEDLPEVDKEKEYIKNHAYGGSGAFVVGGVGVLYLNSEIDDSVLVPEPEYSAIIWDSETKGRVIVEGTRETGLKRYEYTATKVHDSAEQFGQAIRNDHQFTLSGLSDDEAAIVSEAITGEHGYDVPREESLPEAFESLVDRFSSQNEVTRVYGENVADRTPISGTYIVEYDGEIYWAQVFLRREREKLFESDDG